MAERDIDVGRAVRQRREQLGWTQQLAAERVGLSVEGYARIERGSRAPGVETLVRLCRGLGVSPNELLGWSDRMTDIESGDLEPLRRDLMAKLHDLDEAGLRLLQSVAAFAWDRRQ